MRLKFFLSVVMLSNLLSPCFADIDVREECAKIVNVDQEKLDEETLQKCRQAVRSAQATIKGKKTTVKGACVGKPEKTLDACLISEMRKAVQ